MFSTTVWMAACLTAVCFYAGSEAQAAVKPLEAVTTSPVAVNASGPFHCIVCDDLKDIDCNPWDHFSYSKNCYDDPRIDKTKPVGCRTMTQTIGDKTYVSRHCTNLVDSSVQGCVDRVGTKKIKVVYCHCREAQCNAAGQLGGSWLLHLILPFLGLVFSLGGR